MSIIDKCNDWASGRTQAVANLQRFNSWIAEREAAKDWADYLRGDKLNRSEIAAECGFALSVVRQNPAVKAALEGLEARLRDSGVTKPSITPADEATVHAAVTRGVEQVVLVGDERAALRAIQAPALASRRYTTLPARLLEVQP